MKTTVIRKIKRDGGFGRWPVYDLAVDDYGRWLFSPKGTIYQGTGPDGQVVTIEVGQGIRDAGLPVLHLLPPNEWWLAGWWELDGVRHISVEICTPPMLTAGEWAFEDLELDPHWSSVGEASIDDEDEFAVSVARGIIGPEEASHARAAADAVVTRLRDGVEPFGEVGWKRYRDAVASEMVPIRELPATA